MTFHYPSFMYYFEPRFDVTFNLYARNLVIYLMPPNAYFTAALLLEITTDALIDSVERPLRTPTGPRARSLFESPPEPYTLALAEALSLRWPAVAIRRFFMSERGERRVEFVLDLRAMRQIVIDVRDEQDVLHAMTMIQDEGTISTRGLVDKGMYHTGRDIGRTRAANALVILEKRGWLGSNGNLRTKGRDVLRWLNS